MVRDNYGVIATSGNQMQQFIINQEKVNPGKGSVRRREKRENFTLGVFKPPGVRNSK